LPSRGVDSVPSVDRRNGDQQFGQALLVVVFSRLGPHVVGNGVGSVGEPVTRIGERM